MSTTCRLPVQIPVAPLPIQSPEVGGLGEAAEDKPGALASATDRRDQESTSSSWLWFGSVLTVGALWGVNQSFSRL